MTYGNLAPVDESPERQRELDGPMCTACRRQRQEYGTFCEDCYSEQNAMAEAEWDAYVNEVDS